MKRKLLNSDAVPSGVIEIESAALVRTGPAWTFSHNMKLVAIGGLL